MAESVNGRQTEAPENLLNWKQIIKGEDPRIGAFLRRQLPFLFLILFLILLYIGNRYDSQCDLARIEKLKAELVDIRYQALNTTSDVSAKSKPSYIEQTVGNGKNGLHSSEQSPYRIHLKRR